MSERAASVPERDASAPKALIAYVIARDVGVELVPAPAGRGWMDATSERFANRCLPLRIANQAGWFVINWTTVRAVWHGGNDPQDVDLEFDDVSAPLRPASHFGHGIVTWRLPYLFRTPTGYNLLVRGPANWPREGAYALEGIVETDWSAATFTMNWQLTAVGTAVTFPAGEPIAMLVPQPRGDLEAFAPSIVDVSTDPALASRHRRWSVSRRRFLRDLKVPGSAGGARKWQRDYVLGLDADGSRAPDHQTRLEIRTPTNETDPATYGREEGRAMPLRPFQRDEIDTVNRVLRHYPEVAEVIRSVQAVSEDVAYPVVDAVQLVGQLNASELVIGGRTWDKEEILDLVPDYYFPITSADDLIAKIADLTRRVEDVAAEAGDVEPVWGRQVDELPPGAARPDFDAIQLPSPPGVSHALGVGGPRHSP